MSGPNKDLYGGMYGDLIARMDEAQEKKDREEKREDEANKGKKWWWSRPSSDDNDKYTGTYSDMLRD
jgi:hypothetical protein